MLLDTCFDRAHGNTMTRSDPFPLAWAKLSGLELVREMAAGRQPSTPHAVHVGMSISAAQPGRVELAWRPTAAVSNPGGSVHGGYVAMVLDDAAALACATLGERFRPMLTMSLHIDYLRPARPGAAYVATGTVIHAGRSRLIADAEIVDGEGRPLARATGSFVPNGSFDPGSPNGGDPADR
jgi:uncharacterized protein (TIGR00369 family)